MLHCVIFDGHAAITGVVLIVTLNEQEDVPQLFEAVHTTLVVPVAKFEPDAGVQDTVGFGVPVAVGLVHVAI